MYKAHLTHWHGEGLPKAVAVKTLKGAVIVYMYMHYPSNPHYSDKAINLFWRICSKILIS